MNDTIQSNQERDYLAKEPDRISTLEYYLAMQQHDEVDTNQYTAQTPPCS